MKLNHKLAQLLKGHRIDFADQIVLDLIKSNETTYALLAPTHETAVGGIHHFALSAKDKGSKYFTSLTPLLEYCVKSGLLTKTKANYILEKYQENPLNRSFYLDEDLVSALSCHFLDFTKYFIIEVVTPDNAKVVNQKIFMHLAPYDLEDYFIISNSGSEVKNRTVEDQMNDSAFHEVITKKTRKKIY